MLGKKSLEKRVKELEKKVAELEENMLLMQEIITNMEMELYSLSAINFNEMEKELEQSFYEGGGEE